MITSRLLDRIVTLAFWALGVICVLSLNDLVRLWLGVERAFSMPLLLCCIVALAGLLRVRLMEALGTPGLLILSALATYGGVGIVVSIVTGSDLRSDGASYSYLVRHASSGLLILASAVGARVVWNRSGGEGLLRVLLLLMTGSCLLVLASPWLMDQYLLRMEVPERYSGSFSNPNEAALVACFAVALALSFMRAGRFGLVFVGALLVAGWALVLTFSRTALIALAILLVHGLLRNRGTTQVRLAVVLALAGVVLGGAFTGLDTRLQDRAIRRWNALVEISDRRTRDDVALGGRLELWRLAGEKAAQAPLFGNGLGQLHRLEGAWYHVDGSLHGAHNQYLVLVGEAGFIPLVLYLLFLGNLFQAGLRKGRDVPILGAVSGWVLVVAVFGLSHHGILVQRATNFVIGVGCAAVAGCGRPLLKQAAPGMRTK